MYRSMHHSEYRTGGKSDGDFFCAYFVELALFSRGLLLLELDSCSCSRMPLGTTPKVSSNTSKSSGFNLGDTIASAGVISLT